MLVAQPLAQVTDEKAVVISPVNQTNSVQESDHQSTVVNSKATDTEDSNHEDGPLLSHVLQGAVAVNESDKTAKSEQIQKPQQTVAESSLNKSESDSSHIESKTTAAVSEIVNKTAENTQAKLSENTIKPENESALKSSSSAKDVAKKAEESKKPSLVKPEERGKKKSRFNEFDELMNPFENILNRIFGGDGFVFGIPGLSDFGKPKGSAKENQTEIHLDTHYKINVTPMKYVLPEDIPRSAAHSDPEFKQYVINFYGVGVVKVEIFENAQSTKPIVSEKLTLDALMKPSFLPIDPSLYFNKKGNVLSIVNEIDDLLSPSSFELVLRKPLEVPFDSNIKIFSSFSKIVNFVITHQPKKDDTHVNQEEGLEKRIQFILDSSIENQAITGTEYLDMFINKRPAFPTNKIFDIQASGSLGNGLIKTISSKNPHFCIEDTCKYYVSVYVENVHFISFMPTIFANGSTLKFDHYMFLIEELEVGEMISYVLEVPKSEDDWLFTVNPIEGHVELFVNPDEKPSSISSYKYDVSSKRTEEILITSFESQKFGFSHQKFHVTYKSLNPDQPVTFRFETRRLFKGRRNYIKEDVAESGVAAIGEIVQYYINFQNFEEAFVEAINVGFRFDTYFGSADFYIKECKVNEMNCQITQDDINNSFDKNYQEKYPDRIFLFSHYDNPTINEIRSTSHHKDLDRQRLKLQVNCVPFITELAQSMFNIPTDISQIKKSVINDYPYSHTCNFVIGINCRKSNVKSGAYYKLLALGDNVHTNMYLKHSRTLKVNENSHSYMKLWMTKRDLINVSELLMKVIAISGKFTVYASTKVEFPSENSHEVKITMDDQNQSSLHTIIKEIKIPIPRVSSLNPEDSDNKLPVLKNHKYRLNEHGGLEVVQDVHLNTSQTTKNIREEATSFRVDPQHQPVYFTVVAETYSILDLYIEKIESGHMLTTPIEKLSPSKLVHRSISKAPDSVFVKGDKSIYYKNFYYRYQPYHHKEGLDEHWLEIKLNSNIFGLKICVQVDIDNFDTEKPCDFQSDTQSLMITPEKYKLVEDKAIIISVQKAVPTNDNFNKFPIDFSIFVNPGNNNTKMELIASNHVFGSSIDPYQTMALQIDLMGIHDSLLLMFESEDLNVQAELNLFSGKDETFIETLTKFNFGVFFPNLYTFKKNKCEKECKLQLLVYTTGSTRSKFSVAYVADKKPLLLKEGDMISIPNNIDQYFIYETDSNDPITFSVSSNHVSNVIYSKIIRSPDKIHKELTDIDFSFKTDIDNLTQIIYPKSSLRHGVLEKIAFLYQPKFAFEKISYQANEGFIRLKETNKARLAVSSKLSKLSPFTDVTEQCNKDDFKYYYLSPESSSRFTIMLSALSGTPQLYLEKGLEDFPTLRRFWKKSAGTKGEEIFVNDEDPLATSSPGYIVGVYCKEMSEYSLIFLPEFTNLIKLQFQKLIDFKLQKGKEYYFDYYNKKQIFNTILYADNSDIEVAALDFKLANNQNFAEMVSNPDNYKQNFVFKKGSIPRKHVTMDRSLVGKHIIVKMKAVDNDARMNFAIFDPSLPIVGFAEKRFHYVLNTDETVTFLVKLGEDFEEADIDVKLDMGSIDVLISDKITNFSSPRLENVLSQKVATPSQKYFEYTITKKPKLNDILIFNQIYVRVKASALSKFSIFVKPKNKFKELNAFESEIVYTDPERDQYLYYYVSPKDLQTIKTFQIQIGSVSYFGEKPELLYIPDVEILIDESTPFLPMPVLDEKEKLVDEFNWLTVWPEVRVGHFVLKISSHPSKLPVKVSVLINDNIRVSPNGVHHAFVPGLEKQTHQYSMFLPSQGEFRILVEGCSNVNLKTADFFASNATHTHKKIVFEDKYVQAYSYMQIADYGDTKQRDYREVTYPVKRGFVEGHGMLTFNIDVPTLSVDANTPIQNRYYSLLSEFKPNNKELILKDYVVVFDRSEDSEKYLYNYEFNKNGNKLKILSRLPTFKPQLLVEYPEIKSAKIKLMFYLVSDPHIETKVKMCGFNTPEMMDHAKVNFTTILTQEELKKGDKGSQVEIEFEETDLEKFKDALFLNIVSYASIHFFDDVNDEYGVTLDQKFTTVPYFLMTIPNHYHPTSKSFGLLLGFFGGCVLVFFIMVIYNLFKISQKNIRLGYEKTKAGSFGGSTKLEMSSISSRNPDDV